ncbi:NADH flavin oxidoreductase/12-oxophytodienoate reductase [Phaeosphaeriaceae sp. PMI808]|nr:NADH flavin oxidoreductase/12-oxophytodienoate reductase [Phaeosphaeriaceae sp. PMI808]
MSQLFEPLQIGTCALQHRIVHAPLSRYRADDNHIPSDLTAKYYSQRAAVKGTLLVTEGTFISPRGGGYPNIPGIWNDEQVMAWKKVTDGVHARGSFIFCQLWCLGRTAKPEVMAREGQRIVSSSAVPYDVEKPVPEALSAEDILEYIQDFAGAAKKAVEAGFDGVEIHAANGYLIDQFQQDTCNQRTDAWGGSIENRARFGLEVARAVVDAVGAERTGIRISPHSDFQGMRMNDFEPQFVYFVGQLKALKLAYLHMVESRMSGNADVEPSGSLDFLIKTWGGINPVLMAGGYTPALAREAVDNYKEYPMGIVFGRSFTSNPDLPFRIKKGIDLEQWDRSTLQVVMSPNGYIDWPYSEEFQAQL